MLDEMKVCRKCHLEQPLSNFTIADAVRGYRKARCKSCEAERVRAIYATNPVYRAKQNANSAARQKTHPKTPAETRRAMLKHKYDLTHEQYDQMLAAQGGRCALCKTDEIGVTGASGRYDGSRKWLPDSWRVDHCHKSGVVRGLLCHACNVRLGAYEVLLEKAGEAALLDYLTRSSPVPLPVIIPMPIVPPPRYVAELPPIRATSTCSVAGCSDDVQGNGLCAKHYMRTRRGRTEPGPAAMLTDTRAKLTDDHVRAILRDGRPYAQIAFSFGVHPQTVMALKARSTRAGVEIDPAEIVRNKRGASGSARSKNLTDDDVRTIRTSEERTSVLARKYSVSAPTICDIRKLRSWTHVT